MLVLQHTGPGMRHGDKRAGFHAGAGGILPPQYQHHPTHLVADAPVHLQHVAPGVQPAGRVHPQRAGGPRQGDAAAANVADAFAVAALRAGRRHLRCQRAGKVVEQQVLAGHWQAQDAVEEASHVPHILGAWPGGRGEGRREGASVSLVGLVLRDGVLVAAPGRCG